MSARRSADKTVILTPQQNLTTSTMGAVHVILVRLSRGAAAQRHRGPVQLTNLVAAHAAAVGRVSAGCGGSGPRARSGMLYPHGVPQRRARVRARGTSGRCIIRHARECGYGLANSRSGGGSGFELRCGVDMRQGGPRRPTAHRLLDGRLR